MPSIHTCQNKGWFCFLLLLLACCISYGYAQPSTEPASHFRMGVYYPSIKNLANRVDFETAMNFWLQEVKNSTHFQSTDAKLFDSIADMRVAFDKGQLDFVLAPPLSLAKYFDRAQLADGFVGTALNGVDYGTVLLVRNDKQINGINDLAGKRLLIPEHDELAELFLDTLIIKSHKQHYQQVFSDVKTKDKPSGIVLALFFDEADAGVVFNESFQLMAELNPQIKSKLKTLAMFPTKSPSYGFFNKAYPKSVREQITGIMGELNQQVRAQQILNDLRMTSLIKCPIEELQPFDKLIQEHQSLQKGLKR